MANFNPRVWLRDWLNKPTHEEAAKKQLLLDELMKPPTLLFQTDPAKRQCNLQASASTALCPQREASSLNSAVDDCHAAHGRGA